MKKQHFETLDGMRGMAAVAVVLYHMNAVPFLRAPSGYLSVDFFFVISGFVIAYSYRNRLLTTLSFVDFIKIRFVRLYPILFLGFALASLRGAAMIFANHPDAPSFQELLLGSTINLVLLPMPIVGSWMFLNVPVWSLMFEVIANFGYARFVSVASNKNLMIVTFIAAACLIPVAISGLFATGATINSFHVGFIRVVFSFSLGLLIFGSFDKLPVFQINPYILVSLLFLALVIPIKHPVYDLLFTLFLSPFFLVAGAHSRSFFPGKWLGELSYPLYATHFSLISIGSLLAHRLKIEQWVGVLAVVLIFCLLVRLLTRIYDQPLRRSLQILLSSRLIA
ncbi:peptidoglycan/LPS O-acetylase OafA/YrhL [Pararhizobium capsulatum DSM 1112]|uniref:Peptidoglycan/LPS O-acetylase OafA/YrhL n=1 Tax=Pararhizobium capsulatum DSM 1112 TaxID=1121113 RepID=A0ABU0BLE9_9HYPH|nr:acyltransferase [Pararhizobium capsulatum]MDQ0319063.1 peptidoglycan/LPS O-acetylase OafA/YrhL [Pararhizobium capsulatum DSM 1112]